MSSTESSGDSKSMTQDAAGRELFFVESRLQMSLGGRVLVRIVSAVSYLVLLTACATFLFADIPALRWTGD